MSWIDCKDRLPEVDVAVLVSLCDQKLQQVAILTNMHRFKATWNNAEIHSVTHWQPLPPPPGQEPNPIANVTRVEVIDHSPNGRGRVFTAAWLESVRLEYQDEGKTLKVFIK